MTIRSGVPLNVLAGLDLVRNQRPTGDRPNIVSGVDPYAQVDAPVSQRRGFRCADSL